MVNALSHHRHFPLKRGDLGATQQRRASRLTRGAAMSNAIARDEFSRTCRKSETGILPLKAEGGLHIGHDDHSLKKACDQPMRRAGSAHHIDCPASRTLGKHPGWGRTDRKKIACHYGSTSLGSLAQRLKGSLRHAGIGKNNGPAGSPKRGLDRWDFGGRNFDQRGKSSENAGLIKFGAV